MNRHNWLFFLFTLMLLPWAVAAEEVAVDTGDPETIPNTHCLRCHGMGTLGYRDKLTGNLVTLQISEAKYNTSNHRKLDCVACHQGGFGTYPHPDKAKAEHLYCIDCHQQDEKIQPYHFLKIEDEFKRSVHAQKHPDEFSCFSCHNAHKFLSSRGVLDDEPEVGKHLHREVLEAVTYANNICMRCHDSPVQLLGLDPDSPPNFLRAHDWLPNHELHWRKVRCIDCHLAESDKLLHEILPAEKALNDCRNCHSRNSMLLGKLYLYSTQQSREKYGFVNSVIMNDAYVIGMTRNTFLERISLIMFGFTVVALGAHGLGRWTAFRRRGK
ncbi:MAG: nitrate reductase [endosymbiont of Escarpia spicata]|uniref:Nitrate reductase n=1 Tax=endosymbiont of Escarpia spicata TaxID=2200908 RepID=A0A370DVF4_9GAMM|nr:MAG: nitrate reductase [endosymbiont of Escarpia spicata]